MVECVSFDCLGCESEVRELLNDARKLVKLSNLRTPLGLWAWGEAGEVGVRKLSLLSLLASVGDVAVSEVVASLSLSGGVVGWEERGPPPGVGGCCSGEVGGGMLVPSVRL